MRHVRVCRLRVNTEACFIFLVSWAQGTKNKKTKCCWLTKKATLALLWNLWSHGAFKSVGHVAGKPESGLCMKWAVHWFYLHMSVFVWSDGVWLVAELQQLAIRHRRYDLECDCYDTATGTAWHLSKHQLAPTWITWSVLEIWEEQACKVHQNLSERIHGYEIEEKEVGCLSVLQTLYRLDKLDSW